MIDREAVIPNPVKLVIWDLDETLWRGTLSEGEVVLDPARASLIRQLNLRGIVNSISSKNNLADAQARLEAEEIWDQFVFPSINWQPKGQQIAQIIADMQLRPANVLFIDDNALNLQEAQHYSPGIMTALPEVLEDLLEHPNLRGKDDSKLTRLAQYRVLEHKARDRAASADASNDEFLASCDIHVYLGDDCAAQTERLVDLANRSNQLNFTKRRYTLDEFRRFLDEPGRVTRYVSVSDKYGDYGIIGYYSLRAGRLDDLVFSCRTMNMGIEQWVYEYLGRPPLTIAGEVASSLDHPTVTWITLDASAPSATAAAPVAPAGSTSAGRTLLKGGCDLVALADLLAGVDITTEFNYVNDSGQLVQRHHTETLRRAIPETIERYGEIIDGLAITDRGGYESALTADGEPFETVIYSLILDYTQNLYRLRGTDFVIPFEQLHIDVTDPANWPRVLETHGANGVGEPELRWFAERFEARGPLTPSEFQANVAWMVGQHPDTRFVLLNAPEVPFPSELEPDRHLHHRVLNAALDEVVAELPNAVVCDLRTIVDSRSDLTLNIRHYRRRTYVKIAEALPALVEKPIAVVAPSPVEQARLFARDAKARLRAGARSRLKGWRGQAALGRRP